MKRPNQNLSLEQTDLQVSQTGQLGSTFQEAHSPSTPCPSVGSPIVIGTRTKKRSFKQPQKAPSRQSFAQDYSALVFRIHLTKKPDILHLPKGWKCSSSGSLAAGKEQQETTNLVLPSSSHNKNNTFANENRITSSLSTAKRSKASSKTQNHASSQVESEITVASSSFAKNSSSSSSSSNNRIHAFWKNSTDAWGEKNTGSKMENSASLALGSKATAVMCSCCNCLPFIEIFDDGAFQLCISCATRFERVKRKCTTCHYIPKAEERNRRQCSQCKNGTVKCYS